MEKNNIKRLASQIDNARDMLLNASDLLDEVEADLSEVKEFPYELVDDQMKTDWLIEHWEKITVDQLDSLIK